MAPETEYPDAQPDAQDDPSAIEDDAQDPELLPDDIRNDVVDEPEADGEQEAGSPPTDAVTEP
jgi:hypothetical protein